MIKVEELFIAPTATVLETLRKLDETGQRILFIAPEGHLKAVITDGDIRKFFLRGGTPDQTVDHAANYHPLSVSVSERGKARSILQEHCIDALPVLNKRGIITDIIFAHGLDLDNRKQVDIPVVMMAGGLGTRLYPYTKILPKPLIPVGEQPIAELIMDRFRDFGCHNFTMIVNYKKGMIKSYFNELEKNYTVDFADEEVFMGTGGGLCLLKGKIKAPFFFTNCDTLLDVDFGDIYEYHKSHGNLVTMICAFKHYTVPYGVVELGEDGGIAAMREKPELNFLTNTGVYVVEPRVVEEMKMGEVIGFPDVIDRYRAAGEKTGVLENPQYRDVIADDGKKDAFSAVLSQRVGCKIAGKRGHRQQSAPPQSRWSAVPEVKHQTGRQKHPDSFLGQQTADADGDGQKGQKGQRLHTHFRPD